MDVRFVIGRAGSGKTTLLRDLLVDHLQKDPLWARVIYLVPKQATFMTQRALALDPRLNGFIGVRVIAPDDLAEIALVETGSPAGALLDPVGRSLIIGHLLRRHAPELNHFGRSARQPGLAAQIDQAFAEFENADKDLSEIETVIDDQPADSQLARKLADLKFLYTHYQAYLKERGFDPYRRQQLAPAAIDKWPEAQRALVLVDDFYDFTAYERQIIVALAKASATCRIALTVDPKSPVVRDVNLMPDELGPLSRTELTYRKTHFALLAGGVGIKEPVLRTERLRFGKSELATVEQSLELPPPAKATSKGGVKFIIAADPRGEVDAAAREIQSLLAGGMRLRDIAVLARSITPFADLITASFPAHKINFFLDRRRPAEHHPLLRTLSALMQIVLTRWSHESVFELSKAGLTRLGTPAIDLLEDYVTQHRIPPTEWASDDPWAFRRRSEEAGERRPHFSDEDLASVNQSRDLLRRGVGTIGDPTWLNPKPVRDRVADIVAVMDALRVGTSMLDLIKQAEADQDEERAQEHEQAWNAVRDVLDRFVELLGDVDLSGTEFSQLLQSTLAGLDFAIAPPTLDQVLVGSIDRTRTGPVKATILIGMNECQFPQCGSERAVLNDADRYHLLRGGYEIDPPTRDALLGERFLGYLALTRASHRLTLIRVDRDEQGNIVQPSPFWDAAAAVIESPIIERPEAAIDRVANAAQAVTLALHTARHPSASPDLDSIALYNWLTTRPEAVKKVLDIAWPSLSYRNVAELSPAVAARLFASPLTASVSRFESFAACPFQHFVRYGLRLRPPVDLSVTAMDLGNLYHAVLEQVVGRAIADRVDFSDTKRLSAEHVREAAQRISLDLADQVFLTSAQNRFTVEQLEQCAFKSLRAQQTMLARGEFRPAYTELTFGNADSRLPALQLDTPAGHQVRLRGKIDRIDLDPTRQIVSVVDYKLAGESLDCSYVHHGLMLQLLTYLLVLRQNGTELNGKPLTPAAALYVRLLRTIESVDHPADAPAPDIEAFHLKEKPRGVINREHLHRFDSTYVGHGESDVLAYKLKKDGEFYSSGNDGLHAQQFGMLIDFVERRITELADDIIKGEISVSPYLIGKETPCQRCDLQQICRFERSINDYRVLPAHSRQEALDLIAKTGGHGN